jgi:hypothetical protein
MAVAALSMALAGCGGSSDAGNASSGNATSTTTATTQSVASNNIAIVRPKVASASGTMIPTATQIADSALNLWTVSNGVISKSGSDAGYSSNVVLLLYFNGTIYQQNKSCLWWSWNGHSWVSSQNPSPDSTPACPAKSIASSSGSSSSSSSGGAASTATASASGTMIPSASRILDAAVNVWTVSAGAVQRGGVAAGYTANVTLLLYFGGTVYQQNKSCLWWSWNGSSWVSSANPAPSVTPACASTAATVPSSAPVTPASTSTATPTGNFGIQVKGDQFVSAIDGSTVQIVGTNISGLETGSQARWASFANAGTAFWSKILNFGGKGLNSVRLPLNEASWLNYTCYDSGTGASASLYSAAAAGGFTPDPAGVYQATVKKAVADATAAGLYVILDLHWASPNNPAGQPLCPIGQPAFADADHSLAFWKSLADTFKGNPAVIFELFNEPFGSNVYGNWVNGASGAGPDAITLRDGGAFFPFLQQNNNAGNAMHSVAMSWQVAGMQDMINTIRAQGASNVILSSPIGWAGEIETWLAARPSDPIGQLGVAWHVYGYNKGQAAPLAVLAHGFPIAITETYGLGAIGGYAWAASQHIGYIWWGWNDWGNQPLSADLNAAPWAQSTAP